VVDVAHPFHDNHIEVVSKTLAEIQAGAIPVVLVLNKIDLLRAKEPEIQLDEIRGYYRQHGFEKVVFVSAATKENLDVLRDVILEEVKKKHMQIYPNYVPTTNYQDWESVE
jgi:GTP-binding protein HflX